MKSWYSRSEFKNDVKEYHIVFDTDSFELKERVEKFLQSIMDEGHTEEVTE